MTPPRLASTPPRGTARDTARGWARWTRWAGLTLVSAASTASAAPAAEPPCGPHVAALYAYPPFFRDVPGQGWQGIDKDMFDELARRSGCDLRLVVESRVRIWEQMRSGVAGLTMSAIPTPERQTFAEFVPYAQGRYHLMLHRELAPQVRSLAAFEADSRLRLLTVKGYTHGPTLDRLVQRLRTQGRVHEVSDFPAVLRMARAGRGHGLLALPASWAEVDAAFDDGEAWTPVDVAPQDRVLAGLALSLRLPDADRQRLRRAMQSMLADGTVRAITRRHLSEAATRAVTFADEP
ncbi:substrate-binding periplasmic protein [Roseateles sp. BYS87W]|uniref:Substrate-binding periplasmic protein n=1 Tax=Pelomonas baiyunensis TaxID=3299026 RepID=A0ABW7H1X4_9BURK